MEVHEFTPVFLPLDQRSAREGMEKFAAGILANVLLLLLVVLSKPMESTGPIRHSSRQIVLLVPSMATARLPQIVRARMIVEKAKPRQAKLGLPQNLKVPVSPAPMAAPPLLSASASIPSPAIAPIPVRTLEAPVLKPIVGSFSEAPVRASAKIANQPARVVTGDFAKTLGAADPGRGPRLKTELGSFSDAGVASGKRSVAAEATTQDAGFSVVAVVAHSRSRLEPVRDSGFGAVDRSGARQNAAVSTVAESGFESPATKASNSRKSSAHSLEANTKAVEIFGKPRPLYTEEARRLRIEGEVLLRILFGADGKLGVQSIVRGLGHGLDENAALAAAQIQFRPATQNGLAVDQTAVIRVRFQLVN